MTCFHPVVMYDTEKLTVNGKRLYTHQYDPRFDRRKIHRPCGSCIGCRLEYSRQWAIRMVHESKMHSENSFITLTYRDEDQPSDKSLKKKHFQDFMKRLREYYSPKKIRFYHCGEYGSEFGRPHYHAILFGHDFSDKKYWRKTKRKEICYRSSTLEKLWTFGNSEIGSVTFESCAYIARYVTKKITGDRSDEHYFDPLTGVLRQPEYATMSLKPGIGATWFDKFQKDVFPSDQVIMRGIPMKPPKYYSDRFEISKPLDFDEIKLDRFQKALLLADNNSLDRLPVREESLLLKLRSLKRSIQ